MCARDECPFEWCLTLASPSFPLVLFFCSSKIVGSLAFVFSFSLFRGMESFWWTTFDGLYCWTCILDDQSTWWSWHLSKGNDVWSSSKCQKIAMWVQFYSCMALDRTCMVASKWELPHFSFLKKNSMTSNQKEHVSHFVISWGSINKSSSDPVMQVPKVTSTHIRNNT